MRCAAYSASDRLLQGAFPFRNGQLSFSFSHRVRLWVIRNTPLHPSRFPKCGETPWQLGRARAAGESILCGPEPSFAVIRRHTSCDLTASCLTDYLTGVLPGLSVIALSTYKLWKVIPCQSSSIWEPTWDALISPH